MNTLNGIKIPIIIFAVIATYPFLLSSDTITSSFKKKQFIFLPYPTKSYSSSCKKFPKYLPTRRLPCIDSPIPRYQWSSMDLHMGFDPSHKHLARRNAQRNGLRHRTTIAGQPTLRQ